MARISLVVLFFVLSILANCPIGKATVPSLDVADLLTNLLSLNGEGTPGLKGLLNCKDLKPDCQDVINDGLKDCCKELPCQSCEGKQCKEAADALKFGKQKDTKKKYFACFKKKIAENKSKKCNNSDLLKQLLPCVGSLGLLETLGVIEPDKGLLGALSPKHAGDSGDSKKDKGGGGLLGLGLGK